METKITFKNIVRLAARSTGTLLLGFIFIFLIAHIFEIHEPNKGFNSIVEVFLFACFPMSSLVGLIIAYKREGLGGLIAIGGLIAMIAYEPYTIIMYTTLLLLAIPSLLYLLYWILNQFSKQKSIS